MLSNLDCFSDDQAIVEDAYSTNYVDVGKFAGQGEPIDMVIQVTESFNNLTSIVVDVRECDTTGGSYTAVDGGASLTILLAAFVAGYKFKLRYVPKVTDRYLKLYYNITGSTPTTGKIAAYLEPGEDETFKDGLYFSPRNPTGAAASA